MFVGAAIGLFFGVVCTREKETDSYSEGFNEGFLAGKNCMITKIKNNERRQ